MGRAALLPSTGAATLYLRLLHRGCVLVTHRADLHAPLPLPVALLEELSHDAVRPLSVQLQWFGGVAEVRTVHHVAKDLHEVGDLQRPCPCPRVGRLMLPYLPFYGENEEKG